LRTKVRVLDPVHNNESEECPAARHLLLRNKHPILLQYSCACYRKGYAHRLALSVQNDLKIREQQSPGLPPGCASGRTRRFGDPRHSGTI